MSGDNAQEVDPLSLPPQASPAVPESVSAGASGGATARNLDLPTAVRTDTGSEGGVKGLAEDKGPTNPPSPN